jgi:hypothetical protein
MGKKRVEIVGGRFNNYGEAKRFKEQQLIIDEAFNPNDDRQIQIRRIEGGFKVVRRG